MDYFWNTRLSSLCPLPYSFDFRVAVIHSVCRRRVLRDRLPSQSPFHPPVAVNKSLAATLL